MPGRAKPGQPKSDAKQTVGTRRGNGAGKGDGLYGPAKGTRVFEKGGPGGPGVKPDLVAAKAERVERAKAKIFDLMENAQREETQLTAAIAFINQELGMPVQRQITANVDDVAKVLRIEIIDAGADAETAGAVAVSPADHD